MLHVSFTNIIVPVLFLLAAVFYAKLGYMAIFGCCDSPAVEKSMRDFENKLTELQKEVSEISSSVDIEKKIMNITNKLISLQDKIEKQDKAYIDLIQKDIEEIRLEGVTAGCLKKRNSVKETFTMMAILVFLILQVCIIFGGRNIYRRTKHLEARIMELNDKKCM